MRALPRLLFSIALVLHFSVAAAQSHPHVTAPTGASSCVPLGEWTVPGKGRAASGEVLANAAKQSVVLLGEYHDDFDHHRWQLQTLAGLAALNPQMAIGFEAFPRRVQPVLDRWSAGELNETQFLQSVEWREVWGLDPALYMPLFHFARLNRIPMIALNVERALIRDIRAKGVDAVPEGRREGVSRAAPASEAYVDMLFRIYVEHLEKGKTGARTDPEFQRFIQAQQTWDRAMAQAISAYLARKPGTLVAGVIGSGHIAHGYGIPSQLRDLGVTRVASLLPWNPTDDCKTYTPGIATAVFGLPGHRLDPARPRLGVTVETSPGGVRITAVVSGSVAETTGLRVGDVLLEAAGAAIKATSEVSPIVQSVAPGTWLPLKVLREGKNVELVARFPRP